MTPAIRGRPAVRPTRAAPSLVGHSTARAGLTAHHLDKHHPTTALTPSRANHCPLFRCLTDGVHPTAKKFVESFSWHGSITAAYVGLAVADIVGVFLFDQDSKFKRTDRFIWVIVGDIPSAYLVTDFAPNAAMALNVYIGLMSEWVIAARNGDNVDKLIPVNVPPTMENARELEKRLTFLRDDILAPYKNDLA